jgi:uncharacterized protein YxjI
MISGARPKGGRFMKLYVKQKVISWSDKFNVKNAEKEDMYFVEGEFFSMGSKLHIYNKFRDEVGFVKQNFFSLRPRFEVYRSGVKSAEVIKKYNWLEPEYDINGLDWTVKGDSNIHEYDINGGFGKIASVKRVRFFWGESCEIDVINPADELLVLGTVLALDCVNGTRR